MKKKTVVFAGWGTPESYFRQVLDGLFSNFDLVNTLEHPFHYQQLHKTYDIAICHSQGLHHFVNSEAYTKHLVIVAGFLKFCPNEDKLCERTLIRMQRRFESNPLEVLQNFHQRGGNKFDLTELSKLQKEIMQKHLQALQAQEIQAEMIQKKVSQSLTLWHITEDPILSAESSQILMEGLQVESIPIKSNAHFPTKAEWKNICSNL